MSNNEKYCNMCCCLNCSEIPNDIPLGTSPQDAYVRTNMNLKNEISNVNEYINNQINTVNDKVYNEVNKINNRVDNIIANSTETDGNSELVDIRTGIDGTMYESAGQSVRIQIENLYTDTYNLMDLKSPVWFDDNIGNMYNYMADTYGYYVNYKNGQDIPQSGYYLTNYIEVIPHKTIYKNYVGYGAFYDLDKNYISGHDYNTLSYIVPSNAKYYRTAFSNAQRTTAYISYKNEYSAYTEKNTFTITNESFIDWLNNNYQDINADNQRYSGKKIAILGDSWSDTENNTSTKKWYDWIAEKTGAAIQCLAVSGTGYKKEIAVNDSVSNFMQQALMIDSDTDLVIIFGSGNDCNSVKNLNFNFGTAKDKTTNTIGGCMNITLDNIQKTAPHSRILMLSPVPWISYDPWWEGESSGIMGVYAELMKNVAYYRGIRFKDMYHSSDMHPQNSDFKAAFYNSDGVHPNNAGQKRIYPDILAEVKAILPESD